MENREIEVRFLEIDKEDLIAKIKALDGEDLGEKKLEETIFYDKERKWAERHRLVRIRDNGKKIKLSYKEHMSHSIDGSEEVEFEITDKIAGTKFLEKIDLKAFRFQEKLRHTLSLGDITFDIDTWPRVPTYVEIEGPDEKSLKEVVLKLGLDWADAVFENAGFIIEKRYNIPVLNMTYFTFDRFE
ncbi:MAG: CYTH domain-containing protein [Patescibacteria group bacterium]